MKRDWRIKISDFKKLALLSQVKTFSNLGIPFVTSSKPKTRFKEEIMIFFRILNVRILLHEEDHSGLQGKTNTVCVYMFSKFSGHGARKHLELLHCLKFNFAVSIMLRFFTFFSGVTHFQK